MTTPPASPSSSCLSAASDSPATAPLIDWLTLWRLPGISNRMVHQILMVYPGPGDFLSENPRHLQKRGFSEAIVETLGKWQQGKLGVVNEGIQLDLRWQEASGNGVLTLQDAKYPLRLKEIHEPPAVLFVKGESRWLESQQLAMVGSRRASAGGRRLAEDMARALVAQGLVVTSGLAQGIDGAAHEGALAAGGATVAVCAHGLDICYPRRHRALFEQIAEQGVLLSEYPVGVAPQPWQFPARNRLISGLSLGTLVVEAAIQSGSLITARYALEQNREVFAVPGSIHSPHSKGCHQLIKAGAKLVECVDDVLAELGLEVMPSQLHLPMQKDAALPELTAEERILLPWLLEPVTADRLQSLSGLETGVLMTVLMALQLKGCIEENNGHYQLCVDLPSG